MSKSIAQILKLKGSDVWSIGPEDKVYDALVLMAEKGVGALVVIDEEKVVGIFTERDYARKVILEGRSSLKTVVQKIMSTKILYITPDMSVEEGLALMADKRCRHLPVFEDKELVGMISIGDLVNAYVAEKDFMINQLEHYIHGS